jgi:hypothetical protein
MSEKAHESLVEAIMRINDPTMQRTIELDCPPGSPRPGDLIAEVIEGTGLELRDTVSRFFGNWKWDYNDVSQEEWDKLKPILRERIKALYQRGVIRYGSW